MDEEPNDWVERQHREFIDALTLIASAIGTQTEWLENVCECLDKIDSRLITHQTDKPYLIKETIAEILEKLNKED